jgi:hypothetical protein
MRPVRRPLRGQHRIGPGNRPHRDQLLTGQRPEIRPAHIQRRQRARELLARTGRRRRRILQRLQPLHKHTMQHATMRIR